jgi:UDP-glucose 4-epimerase
MSDKRKYLITGSEGFIGRNLKKELAKIVGWENITGIDIVSEKDHYHDTFIRSPVENLLDHEPSDRINGIFHLAAMSSPVEVKNYPFDGIKSNILGTVSVLEFAIHKFINSPDITIASSSAITSDSLYGLTKRTSEEIADYYRKNYKLNIATCRFFNTFGNYERKGNYTSIPTQFLDRAMKDKPIVIYGNGKQSRDFIYVKDLVQWLMDVDFRKRSGIFDFGTGITTSFNDLANMIIRLTNSKSRIEYVKNPLKSYQEFTKANSPYSKPKYTLEGALTDMIQERKRAKHANS